MKQNKTASMQPADGADASVREFIDRIVTSIEETYMDDLLREFSLLDRLSGTADAGASVDYILKKLEEFGVERRCYEFPAYLCDPLDSSLVLVTKEGEQVFASRPRSFSESCPQGLEAALWYDEEESAAALAEKVSQFRGRVVVSGNYDEDYARILSDLGAAALIQVWKSDEEIVHEDTVGSVWGTPTEKTISTLTRIPVLGVAKRTGEILRQAAGRPETEARVKLTSRLHCHVQTLRLPVAVIPGKTRDFALLSGHYDSWYYGATDNGTGNALCLELARLFQREQPNLERGVIVAWWPGHSNGRYAGSTWYCDNFWKELDDHCVAHINIDSPGCMGAERVVMGTTRFEGTAFTEDIIRRHTAFPVKGFSQLFKGADQSFFGCRIPIHMYPMYKQAETNKQYASPGSGGGWWWHTNADTLDKVDMDILRRDTGYIADMLGQIVFAPLIPADLDNYFTYIRDILRDYEQNSGPEFSFAEILTALDSLEQAANAALKRCGGDCSEQNRVLKAVGGELNRLMNTYSERYELDRAMPAALFPGLGIVKGISRETYGEERHLFISTEFVRQKNRFLCETEKLEQELNRIAAPTANLSSTNAVSGCRTEAEKGPDSDTYNRDDRTRKE